MSLSGGTTSGSTQGRPLTDEERALLQKQSDILDTQIEAFQRQNAALAAAFPSQVQFLQQSGAIANAALAQNAQAAGITNTKGPATYSAGDKEKFIPNYLRWASQNAPGQDPNNADLRQRFTDETGLGAVQGDPRNTPKATNLHDPALREAFTAATGQGAWSAERGFNPQYVAFANAQTQAPSIGEPIRPDETFAFNREVPGGGPAGSTGLPFGEDQGLGMDTIGGKTPPPGFVPGPQGQGWVPIGAPVPGAGGATEFTVGPGGQGIPARAGLQGLQALTPDQQRLIDQVYASAGDEGLRLLTRSNEAAAAARGLRLSDSPAGQQFAEETRNFASNLAGAKAQQSLGLSFGEQQLSLNQQQLAEAQRQFDVQASRQERQFREDTRRFQEGLRQQAYANRLALTGQSGANNPIFNSGNTAAGASSNIGSTLAFLGQRAGTTTTGSSTLPFTSTLQAGGGILGGLGTLATGAASLGRFANASALTAPTEIIGLA